MIKLISGQTEINLSKNGNTTTTNPKMVTPQGSTTNTINTSPKISSIREGEKEVNI